jgi:RNA polymerase sigma-70 factor (ECF subfamily)
LRELWERGLAGDTAAYHDFLRKLSGHLRSFLKRRLRRWPDDVEDLLQETLLALHVQRHTYNADYPLTAWIHAIARYKLIDLLRRRARTDDQSVSFEDVDELLFSTSDEAHEARQDILKLLAELPDRQRLPIVHVKLEGLSVVHVAALTGMSVSAVKIGIHRGLKLLAAKLRDSN